MSAHAIAARDPMPHAACQGTATQLDGPQLSQCLAGLPGWSVHAGRLRRAVRFRGFPAAVSFATAVALLAERENHHPTFTVDKHTVELELWTRKLQAITTLDVDFAAAVERLIEEW
jgi:4a-hydroxytetrahydrobiopterin dehydratase